MSSAPNRVFGGGLRETLASQRKELAGIAAFDLIGALPVGHAHVVGSVSPPDRIFQRLRVNAETGVELTATDVPRLGAADEMIETRVLTGVCQRGRRVKRNVVLGVELVEVAGGHRNQPRLVIFLVLAAE